MIAALCRRRVRVGDVTPPSEGLWEPEPEGMTVYNGADLTFDSLTAPSGWSYEFLGAPEDEIIAEGPTYANSVRFGWPISEPGNQQVCRINTAAFGSTAYRSVCMGAVVRPNAGWVQHPSGTKLFYPFAQDSEDASGARPFELKMKPYGDGSQFKLQVETYTGDTIAVLRNPNLADTVYDNAVWLQVLLFASYVGADPAAQTGLLKWWTRRFVDGAWTAWEQNADHSDVKMGRSTHSTGYWRNPQFNLFWGGGVETLPSTQYFDLNRFRVSVGA